MSNKVHIVPLLILQAESSRQMYRAMMEQVVRFLERAYKNLDLIKNRMEPRGNANKLSPSRYELIEFVSYIHQLCIHTDLLSSFREVKLLLKPRCYI
jgi:hypothetical protein